MKVIKMTTIVSKTMKSLVLAGIAAGVLTGAAAADRSVETFVFKFDYERSALESDTGASAVYRQLTAQARQACGTGLRMTAYAAHRSTEQCARDLVEQAVTSIKAPRLAMIHSPKRPVLLASR